MSLLIGLTFGLAFLALFSAQILAESSRLAVVRTWRACSKMSRTEHFFPKYRHTP